MAGSMRDAADGTKGPRPTTADVARLARVSTATVSYVLNNAEGRRISQATTEAVHRAARELGYRPNLAARNLARGRSGAVLYVVPRFTAGDMPLRAGSRMTTELARLGFLQVQIFETDDDSHVVDAIANINPVAVTSLFPLGKAVMRAIRAAGIPHIEIGTLPALGSPQESVGELRIDHLVSRGHQRIAFAYNGVSTRRALGDYWLGGIRHAAESRGLPPIRTDHITQENAAGIVADWVRDGLTAVCAESDDVACMILYGVSEAGLKCPRDLAVIGVDATPMSALSAPPLTTVEFTPTAVADAAVSALLAALGYSAPAPPEPADITRLIVRAST